jgi:hypothetical protein
MKYWEIIADNLSKAGWSWGCVSAVDAVLSTAGRNSSDHYLVSAKAPALS